MPPPWRLQNFDSIASTSDLCRSLAAAGEPEGLAVLARRQEKGRGSRGRGWVSVPGNLFLSVLLRPGGAVRDSGMWSLLAGVALAEAAANWVPADRLTLKWPNDLLLDDAKMAGILIDSSGDAERGLTSLVIGFGVNLAGAPEVAGRRTVAVAAVAAAPSPEDFAAVLLERVGHWYGICRSDGFASVRAAWLERAQPLGAAMTLALPDRAVSGEFAGVGPDGSLRLRVCGETLGFSVGELQLEPSVQPPGLGA